MFLICVYRVTAVCTSKRFEFVTFWEYFFCVQFVVLCIMGNTVVTFLLFLWQVVYLFSCLFICLLCYGYPLFCFGFPNGDFSEVFLQYFHRHSPRRLPCEVSRPLAMHSYLQTTGFAAVQKQVLRQSTHVSTQTSPVSFVLTKNFIIIIRPFCSPVTSSLSRLNIFLNSLV